VTVHDPVSLRIQRLSRRDQVLVLAHFAGARAVDRLVSPKAVTVLFYDIGLPVPSNVNNDFVSLARLGLLARGRLRGQYRVTPLGKSTADGLVSQVDRASLEAETAAYGGSELGQAVHATVPPSLAPPALIEPLRNFLAEHPFDTNVFGMTRFPDAQAGTPDPVGQALDIARVVCREHGLEFHLASDRAMHDDLWTNVTAHMWASRYGIGLFEDRVDRGLNHNLTIEIGGMLMTGRRCALLKDGTLDKMPTDLVGLIYKAIDLSDTATVADALHGWICDDLGLSRCSSCPAASPSLHAPTA
jgi:hypothetical protein